MQGSMQVYSGGKPFKCATCGKCVTTITSLRNHKTTHFAARPYKCSVCPLSFKQKQYLQRHELVHSEEKPYKCSVCCKSFRQVGGLKTHQVTHTNLRFSCPQCPRQYKSKMGLKRHVKLDHSVTPQSTFDCIFCNISFRRYIGYFTHLLTHVREKSYNCELCPQEFATVGARNVHIRRQHTQEKPYPCGTCELRFTTAGELGSHSITHMPPDSKPLPHNCIFCGKGFSVRSNLFRHIRYHTQEKAHSCGICGKECSTITNMKVHIKRIHKL